MTHDDAMRLAGELVGAGYVKHRYMERAAEVIAKATGATLPAPASEDPALGALRKLAAMGMPEATAEVERLEAKPAPASEGVRYFRDGEKLWRYCGGSRLERRRSDGWGASVFDDLDDLKDTFANVEEITPSEAAALLADPVPPKPEGETRK